MGRNSVLRLAHRAGMPVYKFCLKMVEQHGHAKAAADALHVSPSSIGNWLQRKLPHYRLTRLADAKGLDVIPYIVEMADKHGSLANAERKLGFKPNSFGVHLRNAGIRMYDLEPLDTGTKREVVRLLNEGKRVGEVARATGVHPSTVSWYKAKLQRVKQVK